MNEREKKSSYMITLRLFHPSMASGDIVRVLGIKPNIEQSVGDPRVSPKGSRLEGFFARTFVTVPLIAKREGCFIDGVAEVLDSLESRKAFLSEMTASGGVAQLLVGVFSGENHDVLIDLNAMRRLVACSLELRIDSYYEPR